MNRREELDRAYEALSWEERTRRGPMFYFTNETVFVVPAPVVFSELLPIEDYQELNPEPGGLAGWILKTLDDRAYILAMFEHYARGLNRLL